MLALVLTASLTQAPSETDAAMGVLRRTIGSRASAFRFESLPVKKSAETFQVEALDGTVTVKGTSAVAMCRGAYEFLKDACNVQVSWSGDNLKLPPAFPDYPRRTVASPNRYRHYFNVCTFGYTTVWWDWKRWEKEIDWMALHGINVPLAMNGQEKVWQKVFRDLGVPDASIREHFSGPAFLPWHRMGNLNSHMGPLPQSWIDGQAELQKKILGRERELGMTPVVPGFSGFVPVDFDKVHPDVKLASPTAWAGFAPTKFVDVRSPMFIEIGRRFVEEYRKEFGSDHLYLCDTFNEQNPQFPAATKLEDLKQAAKAVYESIRQADPAGVWVMQGWLFYNAQDYWGKAEVEALLSGVPDGRMIILDLASNEHEVWRRHPSVKNKGWIFNTLHNYGQSTGLFGALQKYADTAAAAVGDPDHGQMLGMGLTMEGIDQNPVVYELMTDAMWTRERIDVGRWLDGYVRSRYGSLHPSARDAWTILTTTLYADAAPWYRAAWRTRPRPGVQPPPFDLAKIKAAAEGLLRAAPQLGENTLYRRDLVDVTKTWLGGVADTYLTAAVLTGLSGDASGAKHRHTFFAMLMDLDRLLATRPEHRLSTWIRDARSWGRNEAERTQMEQNARMQITTWGGPVLYDYANKEWAGIAADFNVPRWKMFFDSLDGGKPANFAQWEETWALSTKRPAESRGGNEVEVAREVLAKYGSLETSLQKLIGLKDEPGIAVGKPVRDSGGTERGGDPKLAVDGSMFGGYWAASPSPQWIEIDLEKPTQVTGVHLVPYYGDDRYYQYKVELSEDGQIWRTAVDASMNTKRATMLGYRHEWAAVSARYVRVTMLKNSANVGVHLHELKVLGTR